MQLISNLASSGISKMVSNLASKLGYTLISILVSSLLSYRVFNLVSRRSAKPISLPASTGASWEGEFGRQREKEKETKGRRRKHDRKDHHRLNQEGTESIDEYVGRLASGEPDEAGSFNPSSRWVRGKWKLLTSSISLNGCVCTKCFFYLSLINLYSF